MKDFKIQIGGEELFNTLLKEGYKVDCNCAGKYRLGYYIFKKDKLSHINFDMWDKSDLEEITFAEALRLIEEDQKTKSKKPLPKFIVDALTNPVAHKALFRDDNEAFIVDALIGIDIDYSLYQPWMGLNNEYHIIAPFNLKYYGKNKSPDEIDGDNLTDYLSLKDSIKYYDKEKDQDSDYESRL